MCHPVGTLFLLAVVLFFVFLISELTRLLKQLNKESKTGSSPETSLPSPPGGGSESPQHPKGDPAAEILQSDPETPQSHERRPETTQPPGEGPQQGSESPQPPRGGPETTQPGHAIQVTGNSPEPKETTPLLPKLEPINT